MADDLAGLDKESLELIGLMIEEMARADGFKSFNDACVFHSKVANIYTRYGAAALRVLRGYAGAQHV